MGANAVGGVATGGGMAEPELLSANNAAVNAAANPNVNPTINMLWRKT